MFEPRRQVALGEMPGKTKATKTTLLARRLCCSIEMVMREARRVANSTTEIHRKSGARFAVGFLHVQLTSMLQKFPAEVVVR